LWVVSAIPPRRSEPKVVSRHPGLVGAKYSDKYREALDAGPYSSSDSVPALVLGALFLFVFILLVIGLFVWIGSEGSRHRYGDSIICPTCGGHVPE